MARTLLLSSAAALSFADPAFAQEAEATPPVALGGRYVIDAVHVAEGEQTASSFVLHNIEATAVFDLEAIAGIGGLTAGGHILGNTGGRPNDGAGTLQGVNNIEVAEPRLKLYEAWIEQALAGGRASLRLGLSDLNADFYQNDSAGLLIAPAFGIGSELAATGPNGPSIFPSTALTARLAMRVGGSGYVRAAVVNAHAGVLGDTDGVDFRFRDGALLIAEAGTTRGGKLALGYWRYTHRQDDVRAVTPLGDPLQRVANGAYLLADQQVAGGEDKGVHLFLRAGISEGRTTPFRGGFQTGALLRGFVPGRPHAQLSFGYQHGLLSRGFRANLVDDGFEPDIAESGVELTFADQVAPFLTVQPDVQYVRRAYASGASRRTLVIGLRLEAAFGDD